MIQEFSKIREYDSELNLPGDKSISHRALIFSAMAKGKSNIINLSKGEDVYSTITCLQLLGAKLKSDSRHVTIDGCGCKGFRKPSSVLYAGNSGTTARLLSGVLAAQNFSSEITGDESLSMRPMNRIVTPLNQMNANVLAHKQMLPLIINPVDKIKSINYRIPVSSAQVKSAIILCGLHASEECKVTESIQTRDHTERMLQLRTDGEVEKKIYFSSLDYPSAKEYLCPSDFSTAAFFIVLTLLNKNSILKINNVTLNPTRTGLVDILTQMGGKIKFENENISAGEPFGDLIVSGSSLKNITLPANMIPNIIDEIPILTIASLFAEGEFNITGAKELRYKESDRIKSIIKNLRMLGLDVEEYPDGFSIGGEIKNTNAVFDSFNDHRIAMAFAVLSILLNGDPKVNNFDCVKVSNPDFLNQLNQLYE